MAFWGQCNPLFLCISLLLSLISTLYCQVATLKEGIRLSLISFRYGNKQARDFDPDSLRSQLPKAVSSLEWAISEGKGRVYVHCSAGLGRAPAVAIAYLFWFCNMDVSPNFELFFLNLPFLLFLISISNSKYEQKQQQFL